MYVGHLFPFIKDAPVLKRKRIKVNRVWEKMSLEFDSNGFIETIDYRDVLCPVSFYPFSYSTQVRQAAEKLKGSDLLHKIIPVFYQVLPSNDVVFADENPPGLQLLIEQGDLGDDFVADLIVVDYFPIALGTSIYSHDSGLLAVRSSEIVPISVGDYIESNLNHTKGMKVLSKPLEGRDELSTRDYEHYEALERANSYSESEIKEGNLSLADITTDIANKATVMAVSMIYKTIESYLSSNDVNISPILLAGPTGTAKSAFVKQYANKFGYRLVDFRAAFMSRLDFLGLAEISHTGDGVTYEYAINSNFYQVSDQFMEYIQHAIETISIKIDEAKANKDHDELENLTELKTKFNDYLKPPILFFDELTRAPASVRQVLITVFSEKAFQGLTFHKAKIIAATNVDPRHANSPLEYLSQGVDDPAFLSRFNIITITPESIKEDWFKWAEAETEGKKNIHPKLMEIIKIFSDEYLYYDAEVFELAEDDVAKASLKPFPNYRTWHFLSNYLYSVESKGTEVHEAVVKGFLGVDNIVKKVISELRNKGFKIFDPSSTDVDDMTSFLNSSVSCGVPVLMTGPTGIGKTSRVKQLADKLGATLIVIPLANMEAADVMGMPVKVKATDFVAEGLKNLNIDSDVWDQINKGFNVANIPPTMTVRAPLSGMKRQIKEAIESGRKVILFFDEFNRVNSDHLMSAVFEACSDRRFLGIEFGDADVSVVCAANIGYQDTREADPAFAARFSVFNKEEYDESDLKSYLSYLKSLKDQIDPTVIAYLEGLKPKEAIKIISRIEESTLLSPQPSTRAFRDLGILLKNKTQDSVLSGRTFSKTEDEVVKHLYKGNDRDLIAYVASEDEWAPSLATDIRMSFGGKEFTGEDVRDVCKDFVQLDINALSKTDYEQRGKNLTKLVLSFELEVLKKRQALVEHVIKDDQLANSFTGFYTATQNAGRVLSLSDVVSPKTAELYLAQKTTLDAEGIVAETSSLWKLKGEKIAPEVYRQWFWTFAVGQWRPEIVVIALTNIASSSFANVLDYTENGDHSWTKKLLAKLGVPINA